MRQSIGRRFGRLKDENPTMPSSMTLPLSSQGGHSAQVNMQLQVNGIALPISQMGPDFVLGAIVGAIMGARVGKQRIPPEWIAVITDWHRSVSLLTLVAA